MISTDNQRLRIRARTLASMVKTGLQNPEKIPPWIRNRVRMPTTAARCSIATQLALRGHDSQQRRINHLRESNSYALIVLDACRADYFEDIFSHDFHADIETVASGGRDTFEYLQVIWPDTYDVPYVSAAVPVNNDHIDFDETGVHHLYNGYQPTNHLTGIDDIWKDAWDTSTGACPPEPVLEQALQYRSEDSLVLHYQQPHTPYIGEEQELGYHDTEAAYPGKVSPVDEPIWERVKSGEISDSRLHELYRSNLKRVRPSVLRTVQELQEDFDRVVITADHGEALGEYGVYAHPRTPHHPWVRLVPWVEVDTDGLTSAARATADSVDIDRGRVQESRGEDDHLEERLEALGYA